MPFVFTVLWMIAQKGLVIGQPVPVDWRYFEYTDGGVRFWNKSFTCVVRPLGTDDLKALLLEQGVDAELIDQPYFQKALLSMAAFEFELTNTGLHDLNFNPNQVVLARHERPIGVQVDGADFITSANPQFLRSEEGLAKVFSKDSIQIQPEQTRTQLIVFRPQGKKNRFDSARHRLSVNRLFYGVDSFTLMCTFKFDYKSI